MRASPFASVAVPVRVNGVLMGMVTPFKFKGAITGKVFPVGVKTAQVAPLPNVTKLLISSKLMA